VTHFCYTEVCKCYGEAGVKRYNNTTRFMGAFFRNKPVKYNFHDCMTGFAARVLWAYPHERLEIGGYILKIAFGNKLAPTQPLGAEFSSSVFV
jgi:hypothetical protein